MDAAPVTPTDMAAELGISVSYASMILSGSRVPPLALALRIRSQFGLKLGVLATTPDEDIPALERAHGVAA